MSEMQMILNELNKLRERVAHLETRQEHPGYAASDVARLSVANTFAAAQIIGAYNFTVDTNVFRVDAANNRIGFGTASPAVFFHMEAAGGPALYAVRSDSTTANFVLRIRGNDSLNDAYISYNNDVGQALVFGTGAGGASTRLSILDNGRVLIATTTDGGAALVVNGAAALVDGMTAPSATSGWAKLYVDTADGDLKVIFGDGTIKTLAPDT